MGTFDEMGEKCLWGFTIIGNLIYLSDFMTFLLTYNIFITLHLRSLNMIIKSMILLILGELGLVLNMSAQMCMLSSKKYWKISYLCYFYYKNILDQKYLPFYILQHFLMTMCRSGTTIITLRSCYCYRGIIFA